MRSKFDALQAATTQKQPAPDTGTPSRPGAAPATSNERGMSEKPTWFPAEGATNLEMTLNGVLCGNIVVSVRALE
jgi:hypothetical protein